MRVSFSARTSAFHAGDTWFNSCNPLQIFLYVQTMKTATAVVLSWRKIWRTFFYWEENLPTPPVVRSCAR